jgi:hypothetical protein
MGMAVNRTEKHPCVADARATMIFAPTKFEEAYQTIGKARTPHLNGNVFLEHHKALRVYVGPFTALAIGCSMLMNISQLEEKEKSDHDNSESRDDDSAGMTNLYYSHPAQRGRRVVSGLNHLFKLSFKSTRRAQQLIRIAKRKTILIYKGTVTGLQIYLPNKSCKRPSCL